MVAFMPSAWPASFLLFTLFSKWVSQNLYPISSLSFFWLYYLLEEGQTPRHCRGLLLSYPVSTLHAFLEKLIHSQFSKHFMLSLHLLAFTHALFYVCLSSQNTRNSLSPNPTSTCLSRHISSILSSWSTFWLFLLQLDALYSHNIYFSLLVCITQW